MHQVAALVLSIMYELAYQEKDVLLHLIQSQDAGDEEYDWADWSVISSFVANQVAVSCAFITVLISAARSRARTGRARLHLRLRRAAARAGHVHSDFVLDAKPRGAGMPLGLEPTPTD